MSIGHEFTGLQHSEPLLILVSGVSGVGKDTVVKALLQRPLPLHFVVTTTSRATRPGEVDGVDYFFVTPDEFQRLIDNGEMLEHATVYGQHKGIRKIQVREAMASGKDVILRLDVQGVKRIQQLCPDALTIFLIPTNKEELIQRLETRKTETPEEIILRLASAQAELEYLQDYDYLVVNAHDCLNKTVDVIEAIIEAEHHKVHSRQISL
jgi:guanylate kinase